MAAVLMDAWVEFLGEALLGFTVATPTPELGLYVNNQTPTCTDLIGDYTACTLVGYAPFVLATGNWVAVDVGCVWTWTYPQLTTTMTTGGQTIYGYYVYDSTSGTLMWAEKEATSFPVPSGGGVYKLTISWTSKNC